MDFNIRLICLGVLFVANSFHHQVNCASFYQLQQRLLERSKQNLPADDIVLADVKDWVSNTINKLSSRVEFIGNEIEKSIYRQMILEHNRFLGGDTRYGNTGVTELNRESPSYEVICASENGYEARQYQEALWVITFSDPGEDFLSAKLRCESKIQKYILGHNERGVKIHVTAPWFSKVVEAEEGRHRQYIFLFYLPSEFQDDPPTPLDPMIFFDSLSPKVYAFSNSYVVGQDAAWSLQKIAITLLNQHQEQLLIGQYYLADYEAPFSKYSKNSEIMILMENSNLPNCDKRAEPTPSMSSSYQDSWQSDSSSGDQDNWQSDSASGDSSGLSIFETEYTHLRPTQPVQPEPSPTEYTHLRPTPVQPEPSPRHRVEVKRSQDYLRKVVNGCSQRSIDETVAELFSCRQAMAEEVVFMEVPGDILLRVARPSSYVDDQDCGGASVEVLLKIPFFDSVASFRENNMTADGISFYRIPSMIVYTSTILDEGEDSMLSLLETSMMLYVNMRDRIADDSLCLTDQEFYIHGGLAYYPSMDQIWIPHMDNCWSIVMGRDGSSLVDEEALEDKDLPSTNSMADGSVHYYPVGSSSSTY